MICYTDGSCLKNGSEQNTGGWGVVVLDDNEKLINCFQKSNINTTNNREELSAILYVLSTYGKSEEEVVVFSDSAYCVNTFNDWMYGWQHRGWIKSNNKAPENLDIIKRYYDLIQQGHKITLKKVKGHDGVKWNEVADGLATFRLTTKEVFKNYGE